MNNPYDVLGVSRNATLDEVKEAYKLRAKQYYGCNDEYSIKKLRELDEAYDAIINNSGFSYDSVLKEIRFSIKNGDTVRAEQLLQTVPAENRNAEWYFLSGNINNKKGFYDSASKDFATAYNMEPDNAEYRSAYEGYKGRSTMDYRTTDPSQNMGCNVCNICQALICADCLCTCCNCCGS